MLSKSKQSHKRIVSKRSRSSRYGTRNERLPRDGATFTGLTALPRTITPKPQVYRMVQSYSALSPFMTSTTALSFLAYQFSLAAIDQAATLVNLFDQYRITAVEFWLMPRQTEAASNSNGGLLSTVIDLDDGTSLTSLGQAGDYASCVTTESTVGHYRHFVPHVAIAAYSGAFTSFANKASPWIDSSSSSVIHYGVKAVASVTTAVVVYDINSRLHLEFRSVR
jgi:hypothetical protein